MDIDKIGIGVETREVKQASKDLDKLGKSADKASRNADKLTRSTDKLDREQRNLTSSTQKAKGAMSAMSAVLPALGFAALTRSVVKASDTYTKFNAQLRVATTGQTQFNAAQKEVIRIAQVAQVEVGAIGSVYARFSLALKDAGTTQAEVSRITETLSLALKVNGATAEESSSAMLQLSQAFGKGKLDGDEFRTAMEAMPNVMRELAKSMGVPFGALKDLAQQGAITSDELVKAFTNNDLLSALRENAKQTETISGAWTNVSNALTIALGKMATFINLAPTLNKNAKLFAQAFSAGGLFGGKTQGQQAVADQKEIGRLEKVLNSGMSGMSGMTPGQIRSQINALRKRSFGLSGNSIASGAIAGNTGAPSFGGGGFSVVNVDKLHAAQKAAERALKSTKVKNVDDIAQKEFEALRKVVEAREEMLNANKEYEEKINKEKYEAKQKWVDLEQKRANKNFQEAQKAYDKFEAERRKQAEQTSNFISRSLTDALFRGFESGKSFFENFIDTLKNTFKTLVLQPAIKFLVDGSGLTKVLGAVGGVFSGAANASSGGSSISNVLGGFKDIISSGNNSIVSSIQDLGVFLSTGTGGTGTGLLGAIDTLRDSLGGALGQYSTQIANIAPYAGAAIQLIQGDVKGAAFTAAGTAIGSAFGPVGAAFGAAVGGLVGGMFGNKKPRSKIYSSRAITQYGGGEVLSNDNSPYASGKRFVSAGAATSLNGLNETFANSLSTILTSFGIDDEVSIGSFVSQRKGRSSSQFNAAFDGGRYDTGMVYAAGNAQTAFSTMVEEVLGSGLAQSIQKTSLPEGIKKFFQGMSNKEAVADAINVLTTLPDALKDLPPIFNAVQDAIDTTKYSMSIEGLKTSFANISTFTRLFYTEQENLNTLTRQLTTTFTSLGASLPKTRQGFRQLVDSINVVDEASAKQFNGLVALAPAMNDYYNSLGDQLGVLNALNAALSIDRFSSFSDFVVANAYKRGGLSVPAANMPSYAVGTDYVPNDGVAMLHRGEAVLTRSDNASLGNNTGEMVSILKTMANNIASLQMEVKRGADGSQRAADELEDMTSGAAQLKTKAA